MSANYLKIGDVAVLLKTTVRTIRYYEEEGLLKPHRTDGGTRLYSPLQVDRLKAISHLTDNGFSLEAIRLIGTARNACSTGDEGSVKLSNIINTTIADIETKVTNLKTLKSELKAANKQIQQCKNCPNEPSSQGCPSCPVNRNLSTIEILNLIWE